MTWVILASSFLFIFCESVMKLEKQLQVLDSHGKTHPHTFSQTSHFVRYQQLTPPSHPISPRFYYTQVCIPLNTCQPLHKLCTSGRIVRSAKPVRFNKMRFAICLLNGTFRYTPSLSEPVLKSFNHWVNVIRTRDYYIEFDATRMRITVGDGSRVPWRRIYIAYHEALHGRDFRCKLDEAEHWARDLVIEERDDIVPHMNIVDAGHWLYLPNVLARNGDAKHLARIQRKRDTEKPRYAYRKWYRR